MPDLWLISDTLQWLLLLLLALAFLRQRRKTAAAQPEAKAAGLGVEVGSLFPNPIVNSLGGAEEPLLASSGRKRIILFTWRSCPACEQIYPTLQRFAEQVRLHPELELVLVTVDDSAAQVQERLGRYGFRFRIVFVPPTRHARLPVRIAPYGVVLDRQNRVTAATMLGPDPTWEILAGAAGLHTAAVPAEPFAYVQ